MVSNQIEPFVAANIVDAECYGYDENEIVTMKDTTDSGDLIPTQVNIVSGIPRLIDDESERRLPGS